MNTSSIIIRIILNLPWTILGMLSSLISVPQRVSIKFHPFSIIVYVRKIWWEIFSRVPTNPITGKRTVGGHTVGNCIILNIDRTKEFPKIIDHERVHVEQFIRYPFIFPLLYFIENIRYGYIKNRFEKEAYERTGTWPQWIDRKD